MCSETSPPRLSFSHDLSELEALPIKDNVPRKDTLLMESNSDFEFSISSTLEFEPSSADELFSNGVILPIRIQERTSTIRKHTRYGEPPPTKLPPRPCPSGVDRLKKESIRELLDVNSGNEKKPQSKSFWGFSRSKSLNCDRKKSLICSLPLLSRSNSTGSVPNPKRMSSKDSHKHNSNRHPSSSSFSTFNFYTVQKSPSGKSYGNGPRISPVINVPTPCVSKGAANFFGLGSFLRAGKVKKSKN